MSFTAKNLEACAAQMASWQPFTGGAASMVEENASTRAVSEGFVYPDAALGPPQNIARCNSASIFNHGRADEDSSCLRMQLSGRSISCPILNVTSGEVGRANPNPQPAVENFDFLPRRHDGIAVSTAICPPPPSRVLPWEEPSASLAKCHSLPAVEEARWDVFSSTPMCTFSLSRKGLLHEGRKRVGRWSKRKKQMSHAFLRSLWRWKEGVHARKRRKRAGVGSCSGSGARSYTSDPPAVGGAASTGNPRSVIGTDSSGELFFGVVGNQISWGADFITSTASSESGCCAGDTELRDAGADHSLPCWFSAHSDGGLTVESGYNSEPGYSADSELNCTDDGFVDDDEDDEKQPMHLVVWNDAVSRRAFHALDKGQVLEGAGSFSDAVDVVRICDLLASVSLRAPKAKQCVVELFYGKNNRMRRLQPRLRQTRRLWRQPELFKSR